MNPKAVYQSPRQGFRWEVTQACVKAIKRNQQGCPSCDQEVPRGQEIEHAEDCLELRADIAQGL